MSKYKSTGKQTLFDAENAAQKLSEIGNPLEKLDSVIDFGMCRGIRTGQVPLLLQHRGA
ncbi:MAG: hypothetical protein IJ785_07795 [Bacteroidales bacterium]|nr:hypothetical protein [Bacteroidales bacterium]